MLSTAISSSYIYLTVGNITVDLISSDSTYFSQSLQVSLNSDFVLLNRLAPSLGSAAKLYIRAEFAISLCTEEGMLNSTETTTCYLSEFYWWSKYCLFLCYL